MIYIIYKYGEEGFIMSNHVIGYQLGYIMRVLLFYYNKDQVPRELILRFSEDFYTMIREDDGNMGEYMEGLEHHYCGYCFKKFENSDDIEDVLELEKIGIILNEVDEKLWRAINHKELYCPVVCEDCYKKLQKKYKDFYPTPDN